MNGENSINMLILIDARAESCFLSCSPLVEALVMNVVLKVALTIMCDCVTVWRELNERRTFNVTIIHSRTQIDTNSFGYFWRTINCCISKKSLLYIYKIMIVESFVFHIVAIMSIGEFMGEKLHEIKLCQCR